eukprot:jgi/Hompol1/5969/HPOL_000170-RA
MFPLPGSPTTSVPVLTIQSSKFHWRDNLDSLLQFYRDSLAICEEPLLSGFGLIRNTSHSDCSDLVLVIPAVMRRIGQSGPADPLHTQWITHCWITEFLRSTLHLDALHLPQHPEFAATCPDDLKSILPSLAVTGKEAIKMLEQSLAPAR